MDNLKGAYAVTQGLDNLVDYSEINKKFLVNSFIKRFDLDYEAAWVAATLELGY